jgi:hypothetical protein
VPQSARCILLAFGHAVVGILQRSGSVLKDSKDLNQRASRAPRITNWMLIDQRDLY